MRYDRQEGLGLRLDQRIGVVGAGGIGSWTAYFLGLAGVKELVIFDGDKVEEHNLNRLPLAPEHLGRFKSEAVAWLVNNTREQLAATAMLNFDPVEHRDVARNLDWLICVTDSLKSRRMVEKFCQDYGVRYIEAGTEGLRATVTFNTPEFSTELEELPGYQSVPAFVSPCVMAASILTTHVLLTRRTTRKTYVAEWGWDASFKLTQKEV